MRDVCGAAAGSLLCGPPAFDGAEKNKESPESLGESGRPDAAHGHAVPSGGASLFSCLVLFSAGAFYFSGDGAKGYAAGKADGETCVLLAFVRSAFARISASGGHSPGACASLGAGPDFWTGPERELPGNKTSGHLAVCQTICDFFGLWGNNHRNEQSDAGKGILWKKRKKPGGMSGKPYGVDQSYVLL